MRYLTRASTNAVLAGGQYLSNHGEMLQHLPMDFAHQPYIWLEASTPIISEGFAHG